MNPKALKKYVEIALITGLSGSGKSIALHALEDAGFFCVDNLPPELLLALVELEIRQPVSRRLAIAVDVRSAQSLHLLPEHIKQLQAQGHLIKMLYLEANLDTLVRRFSETRRRHPLSTTEDVAINDDSRLILLEAIEEERKLLQGLRESALVIDTSAIRPAQLQQYIKDLVEIANKQLLLVFESFAYKRGVPLDADFVFDVRMLSNPYWDTKLRHLTGLDLKVQKFFEQANDVFNMEQQIIGFLASWLDPLSRDNRSYVTVAIGCTGGQHRSVYLVERLCAHFLQNQWLTLKRHRELAI